jgi:hypothetical protein
MPLPRYGIVAADSRGGMEPLVVLIELSFILLKCVFRSCPWKDFQDILASAGKSHKLVFMKQFYIWKIDK